MEDYKEFHIVVTDKVNIEVYIKPDTVTPVKGTLRQDDLIIRVIKFFHQRLDRKNVRDLTADEVEMLGSFLYRLLFSAQMEGDRSLREMFNEAYRESLHIKDSRLRLVLEFKSKADELAQLPWEYIFSPSTEGEGYYLAADNQLILTRYVPFLKSESRSNQTFKPYPRPLNILIVVSKPERELVKNNDGEEVEQDLDRIDTETALQTIEGLKQGLPEVIVTEKLDESPTVEKFKQAIKNFEPHVIHIIAHGKYDGEIPKLALIDAVDDKLAAWVSDSRLAAILNNTEYRTPRLVFLHTCKGAQIRDYRSFRGLALKLVESGIPAVVAMQYEVENEVAKLFTEAFYQSLGEGKPIDAAVQVGRRRLREYLDESEGYHYRAVGSPVVYLQSWDGIIIAEAQGEDTLMCPVGGEKVRKGGPKICGVHGAKYVEWTVCPNCQKEPGLPRNGYCLNCGYQDIQSQPAKPSLSPVPVAGSSSRISPVSVVESSSRVNPEPTDAGPSY